MGMANVLNEEKKQQVLALGRLGWSLRRIQQATRIRRETASAYLKAAGIAVRPPSGWGRCEPKPANEVITDFGAATRLQRGSGWTSTSVSQSRSRTPGWRRWRRHAQSTCCWGFRFA